MCANQINTFHAVKIQHCPCCVTEKWWKSKQNLYICPPWLLLGQSKLIILYSMCVYNVKALDYNYKTTTTFIIKYIVLLPQLSFPTFLLNFL